jgi:hypothetical protein
MLELENDLLLTPEDFLIMRKPPPHESEDLASYLDFLEAIGAFASKKVKGKLYPEEFCLEGH